MRVAMIRTPLYLKILGWLALNVILILGLAYAFSARDQAGLNMLLTQSVRERVESIARTVGDGLYDVSEAERTATLLGAGATYGVQFSVAERRRGPPHGPGGHPGEPPPPSASGPMGAPPFGRRPPGGPGHVDIDVHRAMGRPGYEVSVDLEITRKGVGPQPIRLLARADNLRALASFLGIEHSVLLILAILALSALFWWPFVWHITNAVKQLLSVTRQMAGGRLDARVPTRRTDELGQLAVAVNTMGERLESFLQGQRQFMADVAHEVISPVARIQIALGILEAQIPERAIPTLNDVREDLDQMAGMLHELLLFARSGIESDRVPAASIHLATLVDQVIDSEADDTNIVADIPAAICVQGYEAMIYRAASNLVRNAKRYASDAAGPIEIQARTEGPRVHLAIRDRGPGVPEAALARLGEPFYRPEAARSRAAGGFGLGLAIVRRCMVACGGEVSFRNRPGGGFEADMNLPAAQRH